MRTLIYPILIAMAALHITTINAASDTFEIQVFDEKVKILPPYRLTSGKQYRLQVVSSDNQTRSAQWFIAGNLGRITTGEAPILTAVFAGEGSLICRVDGTEQRAKLSVVPATKIIDSGGGKLESPIAVAITLPKSALATEQQIGIEIVTPPGLPPAAQQFVRVIRISPERLVLKRSAQITFRFGTDANPQIYFWESFGKRWVPLRGSVNANESSVTASINHFGIYTLMAPVPKNMKRTDRLQIQNIKLSPRVFFAPDMHRLTITYQLNAPNATQAFVTMDIFDLRGRRIRRLLADTQRYIGANIAQWDGLTDDGRLVRNGRYLLVIGARTTSQHAMQRKLIVVFK
ncbi:hypothetical protein J5I95_12505 [Candidatus Poribacteria bacterium]|nr:hypothetical protein [Candidatus Poribacteria bacterium]